MDKDNCPPSFTASNQNNMQSNVPQLAEGELDERKGKVF
jgi:hypothetical protein